MDRCPASIYQEYIYKDLLFQGIIDSLITISMVCKFPSELN